MSKRETPRAKGGRIRRRAPLLAPAALAALLAGGGDAAARAAPARPRGEATAPITRAQLRRLAEHPDRERRIKLAAFLPEVLARMPPVDRIALVAGWAASSSPYLRLAMARALRHLAEPTPGAHTAIEHLAGDPDPSVRVAVAEAAWLRRREDPGRLIAVLHRLAGDDNLFVREVARLALGDT
jgi:hypothetical protein